MLPRRDGEMTLIHQWLPDLVRLALTAGDKQIAQAAAQACQAEAAAETRPARAAAASLRCHGLLEFDPDPLRDAVAHYRAVGPAVELPAALEDLAVVLADRGREEEARATLNEAVSLYEACRPGGTSGGPRAGFAPTASGAAPAAGAGSVRPPAGRRSPRPRSRSPPWSPGATRRRTSPGACSCHDVPSRPISPASSPSSARRAGWRSSGRRCATASRPSGRIDRRRCGKVSSHDHYLQAGPAGSLGLCPAPGTGRAAGRNMHRMTQPGLLWASVRRRRITSATLPRDTPHDLYISFYADDT